MPIPRRDILTAAFGATLLGPSKAFAIPHQEKAPSETGSQGAESQETESLETETQETEPQETEPKVEAGWKRVAAQDLGIEGRGWSDVEGVFERLPARAKDTVREPVWHLSKETSGLLVSFESDATEMRFDAEVTSEYLEMYHMPATGVSGLDLYAREGDGPWRWAAASIPQESPYVISVVGLRPGRRQYRLYLPLYNGVRRLGVSVPEAATLEAIAPRKAKPIVYYGTSIAQGACASRPGMAFVNILGRRLDVPMINLGFSGNGRLELEVAELIAELDARVFVLDCLPNLGPDQVAERTVPVVELLRSKWPDTPIVMVEDRTNPNAPFLPVREQFHKDNHSAFRKCYEDLLEAGVGGLTYVPDAPFLGEDGEATVDGSHPTDLGMVRYADALEPVLRRLL